MLKRNKSLLFLQILLLTSFLLPPANPFLLISLLSQGKMLLEHTGLGLTEIISPSRLLSSIRNLILFLKRRVLLLPVNSFILDSASQANCKKYFTASVSTCRVNCYLSLVM